MAQLLVQILKKFGSGAKHSNFGAEIESQGKPEVYKTLSFPQVGISKKVYLL
jgi:hypothetical protein